MNYPGFVFRELRKRGYGVSELLAGTGLAAERFQDPNHRIEFATLRVFILNAIKATGDPNLGSRLALNFEASYIGPPAYAAMNAASLADGLEVFGRFIQITFPTIQLVFRSGDSSLEPGEAELCLRPRFPLEDIAYFVTSSALVVLNSLLKNMVRVPLIASRCEVTIAEPKGWAEISSEVLRVPVLFAGQENRMIFPAALLNLPLPGADPINHQRLVAFCERFLSETEFVSTPVSQVLSFLEAEKNLVASLADAAAALGYSERGLRRQLERCGTSYRKLIEQTLERRARQMLANNALSIKVIADQLGYNTPSNFARSFKRWTGDTPKAFRERQGHDTSGGQE